MHYWWVNQNQTFRQERAGGYMWSPKRNANGARNPFYEFMREVAPGDLVLSFEGTFIRAVGIIQSYAYECPKPDEFGVAGPNWDRIGWRVDVHYLDLIQRIERFCRITKVDRAEHLRASHCKPWRDCKTKEERLDGENGLLLTPTIDHLFDRGFISFEDNGELLVSPVAHERSLKRMGIQIGERLNVGSFSEGQRKFLDFHRDFVFLKASTT